MEKTEQKNNLNIFSGNNKQKSGKTEQKMGKTEQKKRIKF
jgi:hypothetical protein